MTARNVTPIKAAKKAHTPRPDLTLLAAAADLVAFADLVYEKVGHSDLHSIVRIAHDLIERWCTDPDHQDLDYSDVLYDAMGLVLMVDMALEADLEGNSSIADPFRATLSAAKDLLRRSLHEPVEAS